MVLHRSTAPLRGISLDLPAIGGLVAAYSLGDSHLAANKRITTRLIIMSNSKTAPWT